MTIPQAARHAIASAPQGLKPAQGRPPDQTPDRIKTIVPHPFNAARPRPVPVSAPERHAANAHHGDQARDQQWLERLLARRIDGRAGRPWFKREGDGFILP